MNIPASDNLHLHEEGQRICIPLAYNVNDKGCLFAGSIYSGAVLAAYRAAEKMAAQNGLAGVLVAKTASVRYLKSIQSDGYAVATPCGAPLCKPNGNHALKVTVIVSDAAGTACAEIQAELILMKDRTRA